MKVAIITPIDLLPLSNLVDEYHMIIPHLLKDERYLAYVQDLKGYKILDNGAADMVVPAQSLHDLARLAGANEIVVPDAMGNASETMYKARQFERFINVDEFHYMGVVQGTSLAEVVQCIDYFGNLTWISTIALPRILCTIHKMQRVTLLDAWDLFHLPNKEVHCLGASPWTREIVALQESGLVRGIDSALPVVLGLQGRSLNSESPYYGHDIDYYDKKCDRNSYEWKVTYDNVTTYLGWGGVDITPKAPGGEV